MGASDADAGGPVADQGGLAGYFGFAEHGTNLRTELLAGLTTFLAMSYIVIVNPLILSQAIAPAGVSDARVFQMLAVITILASVVAMLVMALYANLPFGLAPGLGLNAFFVIVVAVLGVPWQAALAAVFVEGLLFIGLTAVGAREYVINLFPEPVKLAVGSGIGLFLALIGLGQMHVIVAAEGSGVLLSPVLAQDPIAVLAVLGVLFTFLLYARGVRGAIVIGILATSAGGYVAGNVLGLSPFPGDSLPEGLNYFAPATLAPGFGDSVTYGAAAYDITPILGGFIEGFAMIGGQLPTFALVVFTFFFVDFFDTAGTLTGLGQAAGYLDENNEFPDMDRPLMADAVGTTVGAALGTSTVTSFIESSTGIEEGGRTGMTALVCAALFLVALAVVPLVGAIPSFAPYVAFLVVAVFMLRNIVDIQWSDPTHAVPAGLTIAAMPLTSSIAAGIAAGILSYPLVKAVRGEWRDVHAGQWVLAALVVVYYFVRTNTLA
jgi:AGZA family xanthine/uracil permease-like MFS transporter